MYVCITLSLYIRLTARPPKRFLPPHPFPSVPASLPLPVSPSQATLLPPSPHLREPLEVHDQVAGHRPQPHRLGRPHVLLAEGRVPARPGPARIFPTAQEEINPILDTLTATVDAEEGGEEAQGTWRRLWGGGKGRRGSRAQARMAGPARRRPSRTGGSLEFYPTNPGIDQPIPRFDQATRTRSAEPPPPHPLHPAAGAP
jgi:hypothetical protein